MLTIKDLSMDQEMDKSVMKGILGGWRKVSSYCRLRNGSWRRVAYSSFRIHRVVNGRRRCYVGYHSKWQRVQCLYKGATYVR